MLFQSHKFLFKQNITTLTISVHNYLYLYAVLSTAQVHKNYVTKKPSQYLYLSILEWNKTDDLEARSLVCSYNHYWTLDVQKN